MRVTKIERFDNDEVAFVNLKNRMDINKNIIFHLIKKSLFFFYIHLYLFEEMLILYTIGRKKILLN